MLTIAPVMNNATYYANRTQKTNTTFKAKPQMKLSQKSLSIIEKAYNTFVQGEKQLAQKKVIKNNFEIAYTDNPSPTIMSKFDPISNALVRMQKYGFGQSVKMNVDSFAQKEKTCIIVDIGDSPTKGTIVSFKHESKGKPQAYSEEYVDRIIEKYFV